MSVKAESRYKRPQALDETEGLSAMRIEFRDRRKRLEVQRRVRVDGRIAQRSGLRFVDLQEDALRRIRAWMAREESPGSGSEESESRRSASRSASRALRRTRRRHESRRRRHCHAP